MIGLLNKHRFLFEELVKRDFKKKYKRTVFGMAWSMLMPLLTLAVLYVVFGKMFGRSVEHFPVYLFCGNIVFTWFSEATKQGMKVLVGNVGIFSKIDMPKYMFVCAKNVQTMLNFGLTMIIFFVFCLIDNVSFGMHFLALLYPIFTLLLLNLGIGLIMSTLYMLFRDMDYLWGVSTQLIMYGSAIFYPVDRLPMKLQSLITWNPVYRHIEYFREIVLYHQIPSLTAHVALMAWAIGFVAIGALVYKLLDEEFVYYA